MYRIRFPEINGPITCFHGTSCSSKSSPITEQRPSRKSTCPSGSRRILLTPLVVPNRGWRRSAGIQSRARSEAADIALQRQQGNRAPGRVRVNGSPAWRMCMMQPGPGRVIVRGDTFAVAEENTGKAHVPPAAERARPPHRTAAFGHGRIESLDSRSVASLRVG